jgi:glyoxylase I family protein
MSDRKTVGWFYITIPKLDVAGSSPVARSQDLQPEGSMNRARTRREVSRETASEAKAFVFGFHGVRYQVKDVSRSVQFYTTQLGFKLDHQQLPAFASVSSENLTMLLSGPGASGSRPMPDGRQQEPGGWNRVVLQVTDLPARIDALKKAGLRFRNDMEVGPGGRQIQLVDPDGNAIELFEPAR